MFGKKENTTCAPFLRVSGRHLEAAQLRAELWGLDDAGVRKALFQAPAGQVEAGGSQGAGGWICEDFGFGLVD